MKKALVILFLLAILPTLAPAISPGVKLGEISSLMLSPSETDVEISFAIPMTPINVIEMGTDQEFEIFWKLKDDSRTAGFPLRATANLMAYDFASWKATPAGEEKVIVGDDSPWNKYEEAGAWKIKPELAKPVVRYTCLLAGATRQKERAEAVSFYAAKILPEGITRSQQAKGSAARWITMSMPAQAFRQASGSRRSETRLSPGGSPNLPVSQETLSTIRRSYFCAANRAK